MRVVTPDLLGDERLALTASATEDIQKEIEGIQSITGETVKAISEIGGTIKKMSDMPLLPKSAPRAKLRCASSPSFKTSTQSRRS